MQDKGIIVWPKGAGPESADAAVAVSEPIIVWGPSSEVARHGQGDGPIIVWNTRDPLGGLSPEGFEAEFKRLLDGRVREAWIFGSYGTPAFCRDSDIDVFLVTDTTKPFIERALDFDDLRDLVPDMDIIVYTPEEFSTLTTDPSPGFWRSAVASMRRIL